MIDIYNEVGYIKEILNNGLSQKWERDAMLLMRYYKIEGMSKAQAKSTVLEKCEIARRRKDNPIAYNHLRDYRLFNKIIATAWGDTTPLRQIQQVEISKEVLDWFLNLESSVILSDQEVKDFKSRRPKIVIKHNHPMNFNRVKFLFTLYIWTKIQANYLDKPYMHYLNNYSKRFKEDAGLNASFSLKNERDFLSDLGYISINYGLGINASFIEENDVFKIPITNKNRIIIRNDNGFESDLYHPGYWLERQKKGEFQCARCGKIFAYYGTSAREHARKYCKECASYKGSVNIDGTKTIICEECGASFNISIKNTKTHRCYLCQTKRDLERKRLWARSNLVHDNSKLDAATTLLK